MNPWIALCGLGFSVGVLSSVIVSDDMMALTGFAIGFVSSFIVSGDIVPLFIPSSA